MVLGARILHTVLIGGTIASSSPSGESGDTGNSVAFSFRKGILLRVWRGLGWCRGTW
jgi:hypothetical protein